ncbi:MAG: hypothetical protein COW30_12405 [Rhodospirillales bacterium CG15_BIG_FIL_POST_REV_8_21_14_020_66_15]|nr:MAG: hypothetical protein COW30_12405 [Rhodospirillales bacterium CG15_BIG_FIL_POST_REV_8_21_14_020_66_15]
MASVVRLLSALGFVAAAALALPAQAEEFKFPGTFSANAGLVTEYRFRGLDQSNKNPAIQGGIDWSVDTGVGGTSVYLGTWGSNVDFGSTTATGASAEMDFYGGVSGSFNNIGWDVGLIYYAYPGAASSLNYDFWEASLGLSYDIMDGLSVGAKYAYSPEFFADSGAAHWIEGNVSYAVPVKVLAGITLDASIGYQKIEKNATFAQPDYVTWSVGASLGITENVSIGVHYIDTDISSGDTNATPALADGTVVASLTASF